MLMYYKADVCAIDNAGRSPLDCAAEQGRLMASSKLLLNSEFQTLSLWFFLLFFIQKFLHFICCSITDGGKDIGKWITHWYSPAVFWESHCICSASCSENGTYSGENAQSHRDKSLRELCYKMCFFCIAGGLCSSPIRMERPKNHWEGYGSSRGCHSWENSSCTTSLTCQFFSLLPNSLLFVNRISNLSKCFLCCFSIQRRHVSCWKHRSCHWDDHAKETLGHFQMGIDPNVTSSGGFTAYDCAKKSFSRNPISSKEIRSLLMS